jgi:hypothetical protein
LAVDRQSFRRLAVEDAIVAAKIIVNSTIQREEAGALQPSDGGFSMKLSTRSSRFRSNIPNREMGGTVVTVAILPWLLSNSTSPRISTSPTPSPYVSRKV